MIFSKVLDFSYYVPENLVRNADLCNLSGLSDEWLRSRTGIESRYISKSDTTTYDLAIGAIALLFESSSIKSSEIDLIVVATTTPDNTLPSLATKIQRYISSSRHIPAFDLNAACAGFIYAVHVVDSMIKSGRYNNVLLITADKMSSILDFTDKYTSPLFGDSAAAIIMQSSSDYGVIDSCITSDGSGYDLLYTDGGVSTNAQSGKMKMLGKEVFLHAVKKMSHSCMEILAKNNISAEEIRYFIPHQTNQRMIDVITEKICIDPVKVVSVVKNFANCSSSSIPIALSTIKSNIKKGDLILMTSVGAGITYGSCLIRF